MNFIEHIIASISYRCSRIEYHLFIKPIQSVRYKKWNKPKVLSLTDTLNSIIQNNSSICRFGDGEFNIILGNDIGFQHITNDMSERMSEVLNSDEKNILIAIPDIFDDLSQYKEFTRCFWAEYRLVKLNLLKQLFYKQRTYCNSFITRFESDYKQSQAELLLPLYRQIWNNRDIYIIEGEQTRVGVGNDLLDNASNIYRILAPAKNAYDVYDKIVDSVKRNIPSESLIIIALGPTATILAYDLARLGYQALDLGHFDIQYEYHVRGIQTKAPIPGKYVNEASTAGQTVDDSVINDRNYTNSIIDIIKQIE